MDEKDVLQISQIGDQKARLLQVELQVDSTP
jgi:hypothetical protein